MVRLAKKFLFRAYVIGLMIFTIWYGHFMYPLIFGFEGKEAAGLSLKKGRSTDIDNGTAGTKEEQIFLRKSLEKTNERKVTDLGYRLIDQPYIKGRFHHIGFTIKQDKTNICTRCHGNAPHFESKETRSFLNMHSFYLACETCHSVPKNGEPAWVFRWYDKDTGKISENPRMLVDIENSFTHRHKKGEYMIYGDYGVKIAPSMNHNKTISFLYNEKDMAMVEEYINERDQLDLKQKSERNTLIHSKTSKRAVTCQNCHREKQPYIPFNELGYPPTRLRELTNNPVVGMLKKYNEFHIPGFLHPPKVEKK